ncbi:MAG: Mrp/NBP35 family ATP-binding protein [Rhodothermaceae bacterium]|nr:Mrp/NBP35 family ATP-binding protein [Rhodothermaceae bacterium]MXW31894.1 Mrp/NBP35 family ATP-binding protein [Rhodothermaceae bacterium]MXZ17318.1 Mrp/NBP35 family ATP-binding protein [Rhodothermaceae bacterium]MYC04775.1 Mrp/NBP35 family ATP-binding protein [Rhodothermaceae bacterium]MYE63031.1 Mrp/NBP35 family ATP-binding protein [Rhodothermaceae bacterium]
MNRKMIRRKAVYQVLSKIHDPERDSDIIRLGSVKDVVIDGRSIAFKLSISQPGTTFSKTVVQQCREVIRSEFGEDVEVQIELTYSKGRAQQLKLGARHMIAIASGKGGVGKSTVATNIAVALAAEGYRTGLVDTDIYGPSVPVMFGLEGEKPRVNDQRKIVPIIKHGVHVLSMGLLVDDSEAVIWRGPMVSGAVRQFLNDAEWGDLDFLLLDLPPGTGDIQLTIVQTVNLAGAVIVSTPQKVALADARKGLVMFSKVNVPVLGIIENMAWFTPADLPERKYFLFGDGGADRLATETGIPLLGKIPLEEPLRVSSDEGRPIVLSAPSSGSAQAFRSIAGRIVASLAEREASPASPLIEYQ